MATTVWEFPTDHDGPWPCPQGCGGLTEDEAGGPCQRCWAAVDDQERRLRDVALGEFAP